jgi:hypothetical protein
MNTKRTAEAQAFSEPPSGGHSRHQRADLMTGETSPATTAGGRPASLAHVRQLGADINDLVHRWDAVDEVDTDLGVEVQSTGEQLMLLADRVAAEADVADLRWARELRQFAVQLGEAIEYYDGLDEHDTTAAIDIFDQLGPGIALVLRSVATASP